MSKANGPGTVSCIERRVYRCYFAADRMLLAHLHLSARECAVGSGRSVLDLCRGMLGRRSFSLSEIVGNKRKDTRGDRGELENQQLTGETRCLREDGF